MKRFLFFLTTILAFSACSNREEDSIEQVLPPTSNEDGMYTYIMTMNEDAKPVDEAQTRATSAGAWQNQDTIHIFFGGVNAAYAEGIYDSGSNKWTVKSAKQMYNVQNEKCTIVHYKGVNKWHKSDAEPWMEYYYLTDWYSTEDGLYDFSNGTITISAQLRRPYWRLRFKGEPGTEFRIEPTGISYLMRTNKTENQTTDLSLTMTIKDDGYSDYFVGVTNMDCCQIRIIYTKTDFSYSRYFDDKTLLTSESGCLTLPTEDNLQGWQRSSYHDFVDLDLPSGKLWATCNMGAEYPYEKGKFYAWGETVGYYVSENHHFGLDNYKWYDYQKRTAIKYINGTSNLEEDDDAAHFCWGGKWRIPTVEEVCELFDNCDYYISQINGIDYFTLKSKKNNSYIALPYNNYTGAGKGASFWTCEKDQNGLSARSVLLKISTPDIYYLMQSNNAAFGFQIRPIREK